jgi:hypothetical protein
MLQVFEILEQDKVEPLDFSPSALRDMSKMGLKPIKPKQPKQPDTPPPPTPSAPDAEETGDGNGQHPDHLMPQKLFNAYNYAFKQLINQRAFSEAVQLHHKIMDAGYVEGTSIPFDRLVYELVEDMRKSVWEREDRTSTWLSRQPAFRRALGVRSES